MSAEAETLHIDIPEYMHAVGVRARAAAREIARAGTGKKDAALIAIAAAIEAGAGDLKAENDKDLAAGKQHGLD
ncbi:MAG: gamma-glutamyl-phosphate reductase, partial [Gammaproteobacteria bacterium]